jgi:protein involved in polysaccharide export with SLBB domain
MLKPTFFCFLFLLAGWSLAQTPESSTGDAMPGIIPGGNGSAMSVMETQPSVIQEPAAQVSITPQQAADSLANQESDVFGANLFTGTFAREGSTQFNPDYVINVGDRIRLRFWGGFVFDDILSVDPQGNVFLPHVGPVKVLGVRNQDLERVVKSAAAEVFRANVYSYASLVAAQPVRVFVGGFVRRPGLYSGTSMDSLLHYLDQAGGIDPERGSFLKVQVKRGDTVRVTVNLYDFLLRGKMPLVQLADGDIIFVTSRRNTVMVGGRVENAKRFEFLQKSIPVSKVREWARPLALTTHVRVVRSAGTVRNVEYFELKDAARIFLRNGDELVFTSDKKPGTITVRVEGEHQSVQEYVLPHGARMGEVLNKIEFTERSDVDNLQLFRRSVAERQKEMFSKALESVESSVLTARSGTNDEASLRKVEADLILQWVDRARDIEPRGQVVIADKASRDALLLENGDVIQVPAKDGLVIVSGEVLFPNAVAYGSNTTLEQYIQYAGGFTQKSDESRVIVAHRDGSFSERETKGAPATSTSESMWWQNSPTQKVAGIRPGDEILVLPKVDVKSRQILRETTEIIFRIALAAGVVAGL